MGQRALCLGASATCVPAIKALTRLGALAVVADRDEDLPGMHAGDVAEVTDPTDPEAVLALAQRYQPQALVPLNPETALVAAAIAQRMHLPGPGVAAAGLLADKARTRHAVGDAAGIPLDFREVSSSADTRAVAETLGLPVVVKPAAGARSRAVRLVEHMEDLDLAYSTARRYAPDERVLVEEYLRGAEVWVDGVMTESGFLSGPVVRVDTPYSYYLVPEGLVCAAAEGLGPRDLVRQVENALRAAGFGVGPVHAEFVLTEQGPRLLEIEGGRPCRPCVARVVREATGMDLLEAGLSALLGGETALTPERTRCAAVYWLNSHSGVVVAVEGLEAACAVEGVQEVRVLVTVGQQLGHVVDCDARDALGFALGRGADASAAAKAAQRARDLCCIKTSAAAG